MAAENGGSPLNPSISLLILGLSGRNMLKSVIACAGCDWHLAIWAKGDPSAVTRIPWACRSWRHEGDCRAWKGAQDFARVAEAINTFGPWTYIVLTFSQTDWPDKWDQYRAGVEMWGKLRKRIVRKWGKFRYVQTWERHSRGGAHVNVIVSNQGMFDQATLNFRTVRNWLEPHAVECGFGFRTWVEPVIGSEGMAGYLTKLSRELTGQDGKDQVPEDAPPHFRRIRSSTRTLPPPIKSDLTGRMAFCPLEAWARHETGKDFGTKESCWQSGQGSPFVGAAFVPGGSWEPQGGGDTPSSQPVILEAGV